MKIKSIDNSTNFGNKYAQKVFKGELKDNSTAFVRLIIDEQKKIKSFESYQWKGNEFINGIGFGNNNGVRLSQIVVFLKKLQNNAKDGVDFIRKFTMALR